MCEATHTCGLRSYFIGEGVHPYWCGSEWGFTSNTRTDVVLSEGLPVLMWFWVRVYLYWCGSEWGTTRTDVVLSEGLPVLPVLMWFWVRVYPYYPYWCGSEWGSTRTDVVLSEGLPVLPVLMWFWVQVSQKYRHVNIRPVDHSIARVHRRQRAHPTDCHTLTGNAFTIIHSYRLCGS